jgi:hypothetical protein
MDPKDVTSEQGSAGQDIGGPVRSPTKADEPHRYTLWLSIAALCISLMSFGIALFSFFETRQSRIINEAASRAALQVTSVRLIDDWAGSDGISLELTIYNLGKISADAVVIESEPAMLFLREQDRDLREGTSDRSPRDYGIQVLRWPRALTVEIDDMGPGMKIQPSQQWELMKPPLRASLESKAVAIPARFKGLRVTGICRYVDRLTAQLISKPWCFYRDSASNDTVPKGELIPCSARGSKN